MGRCLGCRFPGPGHCGGCGSYVDDSWDGNVSVAPVLAADAYTWDDLNHLVNVCGPSCPNLQCDHQYCKHVRHVRATIEGDQMANKEYERGWDDGYDAAVRVMRELGAPAIIDALEGAFIGNSGALLSYLVADHKGMAREFLGKQS